ncbi:MAG TPA: thioredoxin family protein [Ignavibacteria bacterium]
MVTIRILGPGCVRCNDLEKLCMNVLAENNIDADIQKISDMKIIAGYGVMSTPGLVINDKVYCSGKLPTKSTLLHWIMDNAG